MVDDNTPSGPTNPAMRWLFVHSLMIFSIGFLVTTLVHEATHAGTALFFGLHPTLHHNYVSDSGATTFVAQVAIPGSGPLISLLQGMVCLTVSRRRRRKSLWTLTGLWLGLQGFIAALGYVMLGPLVPYGDTGRVLALLEVPSWLSWTLAVGAVALLVYIVRSAADDFERHSVPLGPDVRRSRAQLANHLIAFPVLAGVVVTTLLSLPSPTPLSLIHPLTSPFVVFVAYGRIRRGTHPLPAAADLPRGISWILAAALLALIGLSRLLVPGLAL